MAELRVTVVLATGGTGGHVFPAEALAGELEARGVPFTLVTDSRGRQWQGALAHRPIHYIHSASPTRLAGPAPDGACCRSASACSMPGGRSAASARRPSSASAAMPRCRP